MADQKLTDRTEITDSNDDDFIHIVQGGVSYKIKKSNLVNSADLISSDLPNNITLGVDGKLRVAGDVDFNQITNDGKFIQTYTEDSVSSGRPVIVDANYTVNPISPPTSLIDFHGYDIVMKVEGSNTNTDTSLYAHEVQSSSNATTDTFRLVSYYGLAENRNTATVSEAVGLQLWNRNNDTGTITNSRNILIYNPRNNGGGTIDNAYGIFIQDFTAASNDNYGIYSLANNYLNRLEVDSFETSQTTVVTNLNAEKVGDVEADQIPFGNSNSASQLSSNLNNITKSGFYTANPSGSNNTPYSGFWNVVHVEIQNSINYGAQTAINIENGDYYIRYKNNGNWSPWTYQISRFSDFEVIKDGGVVYNPMTEPSSPTAGQTYFDSSTNKLRCYDGSVWNDLF